MTLSKKIRDVAETAVVDTDACLSFNEFVASCVEKNARFASEVSGFDILKPKMSSDEKLFGRICDNYDGWHRRAVWRRVVRGDLQEFANFLSMQVRQGILNYKVHDDTLASFYEIPLTALAVGDDLAVEKYLEISPFPISGKHSSHQIYNGVHAILRNHSASLRNLEIKTREKDIGVVVGMAEAVNGIIQRDSSLFCKGLNRYLSSYRRQCPFDYEKVISVCSHGLYRLAERRDQNLVRAFCIDRDFPWDREFHSWSNTKSSKLKPKDFDGCPKKLIDHFVRLKPTKW